MIRTKKLLLVFSAFLFLAMPAGLVVARESDPSEAPAAARGEKIREKVKEAKENWPQHKQEIIDRVAEKLSQVTARLDVRLEKMRRLVERLRVRADRLAASGADVSQALAYLDQADETLNLAETKIENAKSKVADLARSETPRELVKNVKTGAKELRGLFHQARAQMVSALKLLAAAKPTRSGTAPTAGTAPTGADGAGE